MGKERTTLINSMTGYGRAVQTVSGREYTVEIRSVNNRYLDCTVKLPRALSFAEDAVKRRVRENVSRGKVDVFVTLGGTQATGVQVSLNRPVLEGYLRAMNEMVRDYAVHDDISVMKLAALPDVFTVEKAQEDEQELQQNLLSVVDAALEQYQAMRRTEGQALAADLRGRANTILALVEQVEKRSVVTLQEYRQRLTSKMQEVLGDTNIDEARILTEAAIYADKIAVDEETVRLRSHLSQLNTMLDNGGAIGRKLDFLMQAMNREANTIGSKGNDLQQARTVVEIKAELEKIREQMQNIE